MDEPVVGQNDSFLLVRELKVRFIHLADLHLLFPDQVGLEGGLLPIAIADLRDLFQYDHDTVGLRLLSFLDGTNSR